MNRVNLIPKYRLDARSYRRCVIGWCVACCAYITVVLIAGLIAYLIWHGSSHVQIATMLDRVRVDIDTGREMIEEIQSEYENSQLNLRANLELKEDPDWSLMLGLLANTLGEQLVLRECRIETLAPPGNDKPGKPDQAAAATIDTLWPMRRFRLTIRGSGRSQADVSNLVLRLERMELFEEVKLVDTSLEPFLVGKAIGFRIECSLGDRGGVPG